MVLVLFAVSVLVFLIFTAIPGGDPAARIAGEHATESQLEVIRHDWGFDRSSPVQYAEMMEKLFGGELISYFSRLDVRGEIWKGVPRTLSLALGAALLWLVGGVSLGVLTAVRAGQTTDRVLSALAVVGVSIPAFWLAAVMSHYLGFELGLFPNAGYVPLTRDPAQWAWHMALPWIALTILFVGVYARVLQVAILEAMHSDYVRTARAKGVSERRVVLRHALRNALIPVVALWSLDFGAGWRRDRRRRHPDRDDLQSRRRRSVRLLVTPAARPAPDHGRLALRRLLHRDPEHRGRPHPRGARPPRAGGWRALTPVSVISASSRAVRSIQP
jgi:peptide/nickel transport system permease protein